MQALAAYILEKAHKWGKLNSNEKERQHTIFQALVLSIEEDELFK